MGVWGLLFIPRAERGVNFLSEGQKVIDLALKHYTLYLSNKIRYIDDFAVKIHRITKEDDIE